jgi:thiamine-phosphate pyrophosphorylase
MTRRLPPPLVALTPGDPAQADARAIVDRARSAIDAGLRGILVREPEMGDRQILELARALRALGPDDVWLAIHDRVHLAVACDAQAVHLGFRSLAPSQARRILPDSISIGLSTHAGDPPERALDADYVFFGPVLETPSKRGWKEATGFDGLAFAMSPGGPPVWAIGGITPEHVARCLDAGARGIAVRAGVLGSADPGAGCRSYLDALSRILSP